MTLSTSGEKHDDEIIKIYKAKIKIYIYTYIHVHVYNS